MNHTESLQYAQQAALQVLNTLESASTSLVSYQSTGKLLIIGTAQTALPLAKQLSVHLQCAVVLPPNDTGHVQNSSIPLCQGEVTAIEGHLGQYQVTLQRADGAWNPAILFDGHHETVDLILDLNQPPLLSHEVLPFGYYAPNGDDVQLDRILSELPEMTGSFDKPRYFNYNPEICAHGSSGQTGCTRCLTACPTLAIRSIGEKIEVNPYLCQGEGTCTMTCPTGALSYAYPPPADTLTQIRRMLNTFFDAGGQAPRLVFFDNELADMMQGLTAQLPANLLPFQVAELGALGMDVWLSALAYGAEQVFLVTAANTPPATLAEFEAQLSYVQPMLTALGYPAAMVTQVPWQNNLSDIAPVLQQQHELPVIARAGYAGLTEKRTILRLALEHLYAQAPQRPEFIALPEGAPFGEVLVDTETCTLCMACVSVCPTSALMDGGDEPKLKFNESRCVQCSLCKVSCPEHSIQLTARYIFDSDQRQSVRLLNEDQPFHCVECGKAFATQMMIKRMQSKLKDHWMFQGDAAKRLALCEDCRVRDMFKG